MNQEDVFKTTMPAPAKGATVGDPVEAILIQDKSGSMERIWSDTIGAMNAFIREQAALPGECALTLLMFDNGAQILHDAVPIKDVGPLSDVSIRPVGGTALYDAIGNAVALARRRQASMSKKPRTMLVINTDGEENQSREYNRDMVFRLLQEVQADGWMVLYLGANQDAMLVAGNIGISAVNSVDYAATSQGIAQSYFRTSRALRSFRSP